MQELAVGRKKSRGKDVQIYRYSDIQIFRYAGIPFAEMTLRPLRITLRSLW